MKPLVLPKKLLVAFAGFGFAMRLGGTMNHLNGYSDSNLMLYVGILLELTAMVCIIIDIAKNKVPRAYFWYLSVFLFGGIASLIYLVKRK